MPEKHVPRDWLFVYPADREANDRMLDPARNLPEQFNATTYFVDRHMDEGRGEKIAIECGDRSISYRQLHDNVDRMANALRRMGVRCEERVLLLLLDSPEFAYAFFGAIKMGAVPVPVSTLLKPHDYEFLLNDSRARVAIVSEALATSITSIPKERLPWLERVIVTGPQLDGLLQHENADCAAAPTHKDDPCFWMYSSGSTGAPKGCVHLQHDMVVTAELYARGVLGVREDDRFFSTAKLFFAYGMGNALYFPLLVGGTSILMSEPARPREVYELIERTRPTLLFSVPSSYAAALHFERAEGGDYDLSSVRHAVSAGECLPAALFQRFKERFGIEILDAIGSTEALHMFIANRPGAARPGSSGQVVPGCDARILDESGRDAPVDEIGNLWIRSDATCAFYWHQHEKSKQTFDGAWLRTGDKYSLDSDGYYWYAGRADDMLKVSGVWVSPVEIENTLMEHEAVAEVAVIGRRDSDDLVKPAAFVVPAKGFRAGEELVETLKGHVIARLQKYKCPRWIEFLPDLPKTATGKLQRFKLRT